MNCPQCKNEMIKSQMLFGAEFDYCRKCRKELAEMVQPVHTTTVMAGRQPGKSSQHLAVLDSKAWPWPNQGPDVASDLPSGNPVYTTSDPKTDDAVNLDLNDGDYDGGYID